MSKGIQGVFVCGEIIEKPEPYKGTYHSVVVNTGSIRYAPSVSVTKGLYDSLNVGDSVELDIQQKAKTYGTEGKAFISMWVK